MFAFNRNRGQNINISTYHQDYYEKQADHVLIDVRTVAEYTTGHLPNAVNIPLNELTTRLAEIPADKPVVVVCASGNRSQTGASMLTKAGRSDVYNLKGGTMGWMRQDLPLEL